MDREIKERLLLDLLPFIRRAARLFAMRSGLCRDDLEQEGVIAAWKKLGSYDESRGCPAAFVNSRVRGSMLDFARRSHMIGQFRGERKPPKVQPLGDLHDRRRTEMDEVLRHEDFEDLLKNCYPDERAILRRIYLEGVWQREVAVERDVTNVRVSQLVVSAYERIREGLKCSS